MIDIYQIDGQKLDKHPQRVAQWLDAGDDIDKLLAVPPLYVEISPVGQCNHRCTFCSVDYIGYKRRELRTDFLEYRLREMGRMGVKSIMFAGEGEPLLHKSIAHLIVFTKKCGIDVALTTNATSLEKLSVNALLSCTWIKASINGGNEKVYAKIHNTKPEDFDRVVINLGHAVECRNVNKGDTTVGAQIVLLPENRNTVTTLAEICRNIGLDYLVVKPYSQNPNSTETAERYGDMVYRHWEKGLADELAEYNTDTFKVVYRSKTMANLEHERSYQVCNATPFFWAYIMATGDVYGCSAHLLDDRFCFGNINEQSFADIWHGEKRRKCIEMMQSFDLSVCRKNCRMEHANRFLHELKNPAAHANFI